MSTDAHHADDVRGAPGFREMFFVKPFRHLPPSGARRRGMLLLLVLLMLALFMGAGAILLTVALRARAAARAHAAATTQTSQNEGLPRAALDEALLALLRGSPAAANGSVAAGGTTYENLLHDKYGTAITGSGSVVSGTAGPVVAVSLTSLSGTSPSAQLNGRILTIKPRAGDVGDMASFRILGVNGSTCYLARMPSLVSRVLPAQTFDLAINGREFTPVSGTSTPEPYDAPDDQNAWLAWPSVTNNQMSGTFNRLSFCATGSSAHAGGADNDNDGVPDGVWISGTVATNALIPGTVIADRPSPNGGTLRFEVSYLVLDLDGRINLNAAGMADRDRGAYGSSASVPLGMGYGPADLDPSLLFSGANRLPTLPAAVGTSAFTGAGTSSPPGIWPTLLGFGTPTLSPAAPSDAQRRKPPVVGGLLGRSGSNAVPGIAGDDTQDGQTTTAALYATTVAGTAAWTSFADLKARTKVSMTAATSGTVTPQLTFFHPTWSGTSNDASDDPYEIRLDAEAPRFGMPRRPAPAANQNDDSPFTLAECERILRPADADAAQLPQRLAAGLEDAAQRARTMITTESWDTPALTGGAARLIETFMTGTNALTGTNFMPVLSYAGASSWLSGTTSLARNVLPAEVAAGLRFNINRPVASGTTPQALAEQHEYCKDLYTLVMALSGTASAVTAVQAAQWVANVLDYRDEDSRITGFEYDTNLVNGWNVDGLLTTTSTTAEPDRAVAWGAERPEFVITETTAYQTVGVFPLLPANQLLVTLHRPSRTAVVIGAGGAAQRDIEQPDPALGGATIALGQMSGTTATWQLRFQADRAVQFNRGTTAAVTTTQFVVTGGTTTTIYSSTSTAATPVPGNGYLCIRPLTTGLCTVGSGVTPHTVGSNFVLGSSTTTVTGTVVLERLADPGRSNAVDNPYVAVDAAQVRKIINPATAAAIVKKLRSPPSAAAPAADQMPGFWRQGWQDVTSSTLGTYVSGSNRVSWFHWPNRPFVSQAELALVASGTTAGRVSTDQVLADFSYPLLSLATSTAAIPVPFGLTSSATSSTTRLGYLILEATHVPTRFAGNAFTVTGTAIEPLGFSEAGHNMLPKWREPGRVNVNTIVTGTGPTDTIVWNVLSGGTTTANPFMTSTSSTPARSIGQLLALNNSGTQQLAMPALPATDPRGLNPFLAASLPIRLANTATVRSNVFAVWITVRITDDSPNAAPPVTKRLFAIIDRSIPVGYVPGQDWNVRDCIRLKRYLD